MKERFLPRKPTVLSEFTRRRLGMYSLASATAGVGAMALSGAAEAKIVYTPTHVTLRLHDSYKLDLNHDGIVDFTILNTGSHNTSTWFYRLFEKAAQGNAVEASVSHTFQQELAVALPRGKRVPDHMFYRGSALLATAGYNPGGSFSGGNWVNVKARYLGLRFKISGRTHYAWARLNVNVAGTSVTSVLTGYAYETVPNKAIVTGKTKGKDVVTVQPGSLGHLAAGASAIPVWRVKRTTGTTH